MSRSISVVFVLVAAACGGGSVVGGPCSPNGTCGNGLNCNSSNVCEEPRASVGCSCNCSASGCTCTGNGCGDAGTTTSGGKHRVFVTSTGYAGTFGGVSEADTLCTASANAAGLGGTWVAWVSDDVVGTNAADRVKDASPWYLTDGATVAFSSAAQLRTTPSVVIGLDEKGSAAPSGTSVWTGTNTGGVHAASGCSQWSSQSFQGEVGALTSPSEWTAASTANCVESHSLYCFEQ